MAGIVILTDVIAPNSLWEAGVTGRNIRRNRRAEAQGGIQVVNNIWSTTKREFQWGTVPHSLAVWQTLEALWEHTDAGTYGFLIQDAKDPSADHTTGVASLLSSTPTYQLLKRYPVVGSASGETHDRTIKYVKASTFELKINGVTQTTPGDYTLSAFTGVVSIPSDPEADAITWSGVFYVPVHFRDDEIEWELVIAGSELQRRVKGPRVVLEEVKQA